MDDETSTESEFFLSTNQTKEQDMDFSKIEEEIQKAKEAEKKRSMNPTGNIGEFELNSLYKFEFFLDKIEKHLFFIKWMIFIFVIVHIGFAIGWAVAYTNEPTSVPVPFEYDRPKELPTLRVAPRSENSL
tara:strand:- start:769 stop:1158 length:390 start_codon:yes stop_codon:yes gene_type:complete